MLRPVLIALSVLAMGVFGYVGYNAYAVNRSHHDQDTSAGSTLTAVRAPREASVPAPPASDSPQHADTALPGSQSSEGSFATDTIAPNPPNGMTFGGEGHYQLYRQGDLTWRLNTDTGDTCVLFATDEEWRKPKVYKAGCRGK